MSTTLSTLRARARRYLDETTADRWTDAQVNAYINEGIRFAQSEIERANHDYFLRECTFTASAGTTEAAFPSTIYGHQIRNVQVFESSTVASGLPVRMQPAQLEWVYENQYYSGRPKGYYPLAGYMIWAPMLQSTCTFRFVYNKKEADLSADTDTVDAISDEFTDIIALYAAAIALELKNIPSGAVRAILERRLQQMRGDATPIDPIVIPQIGVDDNA